MKKKSLILIFLILVLSLAFGALYFAFRESGPEAEDKNVNLPDTNDKLQIEDIKVIYIDGTKMVNGIEFSNMKITRLEEKKCEFTADVKNTTEDYKKATNLRIKVKNGNGEVKEIFGGFVTELIPGEKNSFKTYVLANVMHAIDVDLEEIETN